MDYNTRYTKYVFTNMDLYPSYRISTPNGPNLPDECCHGLRWDKLSKQKNNLAEVSFIPLRTKPKLWRVCIWGADDTGYELDFESKHAAWALFCKVNYVDKELIKRFKTA